MLACPSFLLASLGPPSVLTNHVNFSDFTSSGRITFYTHPPEQSPGSERMPAEIVSEWSKAFDLVSKTLVHPAHTECWLSVAFLVVCTRGLTECVLQIL